MSTPHDSTTTDAPDPVPQPPADRHRTAIEVSTIDSDDSEPVKKRVRTRKPAISTRMCWLEVPLTECHEPRGTFLELTAVLHHVCGLDDTPSVTIIDGIPLPIPTSVTTSTTEIGTTGLVFGLRCTRADPSKPYVLTCTLGTSNPYIKQDAVRGFIKTATESYMHDRILAVSDTGAEEIL